MNQTQRTFLLTAIERQYKKEHAAHNEKKPKAPSLNNYLTAAVLDGSFQLQPAEHIRKAVHDRVLKLGQNETLTNNKSNHWGSRDDEDDYSEHINLPAEVLFVMPDNYRRAVETYLDERARWDEQAAALSASFEAMKIKVQLGSDGALQALVDQADALCSMSLTASSKLLASGPAPLALAGGKKK